MKNKRVAILVASMLVLLMLSVGSGANEPMTIAPEIPIENPPKNVSKKKPDAEDFNVLFRAFFGIAGIDINKEAVDPKLAECFKQGTSNAVYAQLKTRETKYGGSIMVSPIAFRNMQIVSIGARIVYKHWLATVLQAEYIEIVFNKKGQFVEVRKGTATQEDM